MGVSTIELLLPETNAQLMLQNVLFAPKASVHLISIHQLNQLSYTTVFHSGCCQLTNKEGAILANYTPGPSNLYALPSTPQPSTTQIDTSVASVALPSL